MHYLVASVFGNVFWGSVRTQRRRGGKLCINCINKLELLGYSMQKLSISVPYRLNLWKIHRWHGFQFLSRHDISSLLLPVFSQFIFLEIISYHARSTPPPKKRKSLPKKNLCWCKIFFTGWSPSCHPTVNTRDRNCNDVVVMDEERLWWNERITWNVDCSEVGNCASGFDPSRWKPMLSVCLLIR